MLEWNIHSTDLEAWSRLIKQATVARIEIAECIYTMPTPRTRRTTHLRDLPPGAFTTIPSTTVQHLHIFGNIEIGVTDRYGEAQLVHDPTFFAAVHVLPGTLPPLVDICFHVRTEYYGPHDPPSAAHYALDDIHLGVHHSALAEHLTRAGRASPNVCV